MHTRDKTPREIADLIDRFVCRGPSEEPVGRDLEWNELLDCGVSDPILKSIVKRCERINAEFIPNRSLSALGQHQRELDAEQQLKQIAAQLRAMEDSRDNK